MKAFLIALFIFLFLFLSLCIGFFIYTFGRYPLRDATAGDPWKEDDGWYPFRETLQKEADWIRGAPCEALEMKSFDGLTLRARYLDVPGSRRLLILCHGYHGFPHTDFAPIARYYHEQGISLLFIDERAQNRSDGRLITFGVHESRDLADWIALMNERFPGREIAVHGISMGATTVLALTRFPLPENLRGIIADCGFTSPDEIIGQVMKSRFPFLPLWFVRVEDLFCRLFGHFSLYDIHTVRLMQQSTTPVLFIHGDADDFVPYEMSARAYEAAIAPKDFLTVQGAGHAASGFLAPDQYKARTTQFLSTIHFL